MPPPLIAYMPYVVCNIQYIRPSCFPCDCSLSPSLLHSPVTGKTSHISYFFYPPFLLYSCSKQCSLYSLAHQYKYLTLGFMLGQTISRLIPHLISFSCAFPLFAQLPNINPKPLHHHTLLKSRNLHHFLFFILSLSSTPFLSFETHHHLIAVPSKFMDNFLHLSL
jgi:hypothetical protein